MLIKTELKMIGVVLLLMFSVLGYQPVVNAYGGSTTANAMCKHLDVKSQSGVKECLRLHKRHDLVSKIIVDWLDTSNLDPIVFGVEICDPRYCDPVRVDFSPLFEQMYLRNPKYQSNRSANFSQNPPTIKEQLEMMSIIRPSVVNLVDQLDNEINYLQRKAGR